MSQHSEESMSYNSSNSHEQSESIDSSALILEESPRWFICLATFLLYLSQIVPCAIFITLYPILYGIKGFSEDDLSLLELGAIPWCLKFVIGYLFESIWRPPRFVVAILQLIISGITILLTWIPIEEVKITSSIYCFYSFVVICHDVCFDGQMIRQFGKWGALLSLLQQFAYYLFDTILCFVAVEEFDQILFLYVGIVSACFIPLLWVFNWDHMPLVKVKGIWEDFKSTFWTLMIGFLYFLTSPFSESMVPYFVADIMDTDEHSGNIVGFYNIGLLFGVAFGQYLFGKFRYKWCIMIAMVVETLGILIIMFLTEDSTYGEAIPAFLFFGIITSLTDSILQCFLVDSCDITKTPTFTYSVFQSCYETGDTIGFVLYPQVKEALEWKWYWGANMMTCAGITILFAIFIFLIPSGKNYKMFNEFPTLHWKEIIDFFRKSTKVGNEEVEDENENSKQKNDIEKPNNENSDKEDGNIPSPLV
jgi:predicted MFS family arabinose efflux permease